jgi:class 3 adenylate cyclase
MAGRIARTHYSPGLFDLAQDITGGLPLRLVERWLAGDQTAADAARLLAEYRVTGFTVCSDSAGLTRMTLERDLLEILALIDRPKQLLYSLGTAIGGHGVGIWAADNTQMFYPPAVAADTLVSALLTARDTIDRESPVRVGIGAHFGDYYSLLGGLYGAEADAIEDTAENHTDPGELVVSQAIVDRLPAGHEFTLEPRADDTAIAPLYRVTGGPRLSLQPDTDLSYPIPYSQAFYADLRAYAARPGDQSLAQRLEGRYTRHKTVVLIEREGWHEGSSEVAVLTNLALSAKIKDAGLRHLDRDHGEEIKVTGPLGIYTFDDPARALEFARTFRRELAAEGIRCRTGIDIGPALVFDLAGGGKDIAGAPVNIASKMAQDRGAWDRIYLSDRVRPHVDARDFRERKFIVSGLELTVFEG